MLVNYSKPIIWSQFPPSRNKLSAAFLCDMNGSERVLIQGGRDGEYILVADRKDGGVDIDHSVVGQVFDLRLLDEAW